MKNLISKILGKANIISPIIDSQKYEQNLSSYAGNSLSNSNLLIITNLDEKSPEIEETEYVLKKENCNIKTLYINKGKIDQNKIISIGNNLLGPFNHIINIFDFYSRKEYRYSLKEMYIQLQIETDYMINCVKYGTICTVVLNKKELTIEEESELNGAKSLIKGLGSVLPNHSIINNGIIVVGNVPIKRVIDRKSVV